MPNALTLARTWLARISDDFGPGAYRLKTPRSCQNLTATFATRLSSLRANKRKIINMAGMGELEVLVIAANSLKDLETFGKNFAVL